MLQRIRMAVMQFASDFIAAKIQKMILRLQMKHAGSVACGLDFVSHRFYNQNVLFHSRIVFHTAFGNGAVILFDWVVGKCPYRIVPVAAIIFGDAYLYHSV